MDVPAYPRPLIVTDAAINIQPTLGEKRDICQNAVDLYQKLGMKDPLVVVLAAVETIDSKMPATLDAAALTVMRRAARSPAPRSTGRLLLTMRSTRMPPVRRASSRQSRATPTFCSCPILRPATCWPSN